MRKKLWISKLILLRHLNLQILVISILLPRHSIHYCWGGGHFVESTKVHREAPTMIQLWILQANFHSYRSRFEILISRQRRTNRCTLIPASCSLFDIFVQATWQSICRSQCTALEQSIGKQPRGFSAPQRHYGEGNSSTLTVFTDSDWAGCYKTHVSHSGNNFTLRNSCVSWLCKKQPTVATSSCEPEYRVAFSTTVECVWLRTLLFDL